MAADGLNLTFLMRPHDGEWIGLCLEFNLVASGGNKEEVVEVLRDLTDLYVAGCRDVGDAPALRPAPPEVLAEFLTPPPDVTEISITSHRECVLANAAA